MAKEEYKVFLSDAIGTENIEAFGEFDITIVKKVLSSLARDEAIDIAHAEMLQQKTLYAADIIIEYIAKLVKTVGYLESRISTVKNKVSLEYEKPGDGRTTVEMKKQAGECAPEVEELSLKLAKTKGAKVFLERKYEILIKAHHYYKDIASNQKKGIVSNNTNSNTGWE
jgi:hypothetical protein